MNSLLQTLFMTPEFMQRLFQWVYVPEKHLRREDCIPFQLQLLLAKLRLKESPFFDTKGLTKSFQWNLRETLQQHDVQEFCRVLFDAIEESVKGTAQENMIKDLYEGVYMDYVRCLECWNHNAKQDKFLDLSLNIKNPVSREYNDSIQKALKMHFRPEMLSGDNQYFCENCSAKRDSDKGLVLKTLPYILVLQLKRFELDLFTMKKRKLSEKVSFPVILNMNSFTNPNHMPEEEEISPENPRFKCSGDIDLKTLWLEKAQGAHSIPPDADKETSIPDNCVVPRASRRAALRRKAEANHSAAQYLREGPDVFELFSVLVHAGSAIAGHYYAYIKNFETNQ